MQGRPTYTPKRNGGRGPFIPDGLPGNPASLDPPVHHTDTGDVSDHVFALFYFPGMGFVPRLRDFPDWRLACFGSPKQWAASLPVMGRPINGEVIRQHWGDIMPLAASNRTRSLKPSAILRRPCACRQRNRPCPALGETGRIERTPFMPDWTEDANLRIECQAGLNRGEARHSLARTVFAHSQGRIHDRSETAQRKRAMAPSRIIAAITFRNTVYMERAASHPTKTGATYDPTLLPHTSPLGWDHIILSEDFDWRSGAAGRGSARALRIRPTKEPGSLKGPQTVPAWSNPENKPSYGASSWVKHP